MSLKKSELINYPLANSKFEVIEKFIKNKEVLDCGCVDHKVFDREWRKKWWLHDLVVEASEFCMGVDFEKIEVEKLKNEGYNIVWADVERMDLNQKFDCVVAGELIEHLSNPGLFLERVKAHLRDDGTLIITTPNPFSFGNIFRSILGLKLLINYQHTCFFNPITTKQLLERHGFKIKMVYWCRSIYPKAFSNIIVRVRKNLAPTFIVIAEIG